MRFFIPEWTDLVDPDFDFSTESPSEGHKRNRWLHDRRIWEVFPDDSPPIDGVLVSRMVLESSGPFRDSISNSGLRSLLRLPASIELMGDCGAFGYVNLAQPPFGPKDTLEFYRKAGVDIGVTVDHLIVQSIIPPGATKVRPLSVKEKEQRFQLSIKNALEMFDLWSADEGYWSKFKLMGAIQGETVEDYQEAARSLASAGFTYLGIGGLVRSPTNEIREVLSGVRAATHTNNGSHRIDLHLFGVARSGLLEAMRSEGVASIDSATMLRRAWMSARGNYLTAEGGRYTALRLPRHLRKHEALERLQILHNFDTGKSTLGEALRAASGETFRSDFRDSAGSAPIDPDWKDEYARALLDRPWARCNCPVCRQVGIDVLIFRGNDRNRRRGFHNTYIFSTTLRREIPKVAVVLSCSKEKSHSPRPMPAFLRYSASQVFKSVWLRVHDLYMADLFILSGKYGLLGWGDMILDYDEQIEIIDRAAIAEQVNERLSTYARVYFYGAGEYRNVIETLATSKPNKYKLFPSTEYSNGRKLDILELKRQPRYLREAILAEYSGASPNPVRVSASASSKQAKQSTLLP